MRLLLRAAILELWLPVLLFVSVLLFSVRYNSLYFPSGFDIIARFHELWLFDGVTKHIVPSLTNWAVGVSTAIVLGIGLGLAFGLSEYVRRVFEPATEFFRAVPGLALVPLALMVFGLGARMAIPLVLYGAFWPIFLNTIGGVRSVERTLIDTSAIYRVRRIDYLARVVLPAASPQIVVGVRQALSIGIAVIFFSEMIGASRGIGYVTRLGERTYETADMWAGIWLLGILGYFVNLSFRAFEHRLLFWHESSNASRG